MNAHTELRTERQRSAREAMYRNQPITRTFNMALMRSACTALPCHPLERRRKKGGLVVLVLVLVLVEGQGWRSWVQGLRGVRCPL
jgi:hypothetical protein